MLSDDDLDGIEATARRYAERDQGKAQILFTIEEVLSLVSEVKGLRGRQLPDDGLREIRKWGESLTSARRRGKVAALLAHITYLQNVLADVIAGGESAAFHRGFVACREMAAELAFRRHAERKSAAMRGEIRVEIYKSVGAAESAEWLRGSIAALTPEQYADQLRGANQ